MIQRTFSFVRGIGPARQRELWRLGIRTWADFPANGVVLSAALDARIREALPPMRSLVETRRYVELWARLPARERWRLIPALEGQAAYLDIETAPDGRVTVIGVYDSARGVRLYVRGHNLGRFLSDLLPETVVTFNGLSFDVPVLRRTFPGWRPPPIHLDLCPITHQLDERGGLKAIEKRWGLGRPEHLEGVSGVDALGLWTAFALRRDSGALRRLLEYNLYDVVQLRSLAQMACARLAERTGATWRPQVAFLRGDVLLDMTRAVDDVVSRASSIVPDQIHDEERVPLRL